MGTVTDIAAIRTLVSLVPWDPDSPQHVEILVKQRQDCGWSADKVEPIWRAAQRLGSKNLFWIAIPPAATTSHASLTWLHKQQPLDDSGKYLGGTSRSPSGMSFYPVGHISLDEENPDAKKLDLDLPPSGCLWITNFYVLSSLQQQGVGRAAMDQAESMVTNGPFQANTLLLDTVHQDDQMQEDIAQAYYGRKPKVSNQEWYARRGYQAICVVQNFYRTPDKSGHIWDLKTVFMKRELA